MKKTIAICLSLVLLAIPLLGCQPEGSPARADALVTPGEVKPGVDYGDVSDDFRQSLWAFAGKTSGAALAAGKEENSLYSPISLYYGLAMLEAGAAGKTKTGLRGFLETADNLDIGEELRNLYALMTVEDEGVAEQIANAFWAREDLVGEKGSGVKEAWLEQMADKFYASAFAVDFGDPKTAEEMSRWVEEQTRGKIKPDIDISDPLLLMVLMNTVYFKADWVEPFLEESVKEADFYGIDKTFEKVSYLRGSFDRNAVLSTERFAAGQLPLVNGAMNFILPAEGLTPEDLLQDPDFLKDLQETGWGRARLNIELPKFSYRTRTDILEAMQGLGLPDIVQGSPDFSALLDREAEVSSISQETYIALDEKGVEAAGYTEIMIAETSMPFPEEIETLDLVLNRPFLYQITDDAGTPLFVGIVRNPLQG